MGHSLGVCDACDAVSYIDRICAGADARTHTTVYMGGCVTSVTPRLRQSRAEGSEGLDAYRHRGLEPWRACRGILPPPGRTFAGSRP